MKEDEPRHPWPQGTPVDVDPELVAHDESSRSFCVACSITALIAVAVCTRWGREGLGLAAGPTLALIALYAAAFACNVWVIGVRFTRPSFWPWRLTSYGLTAALACLFGAGSPRTASPLYVVLLSALPHFSRVVPGSTVLALLLAVLPAALRLLLVPQATGVSLAVALLVGATAAGSYLLLSRRSREKLQLARQLEAERLLGDEALARNAQLTVAMSLHDGLGGSLFALRHRLASSPEPAEALPQLGQFLLQAQQLIGALPVHDVEELRRQLNSATAALHLGTDVTVPRTGTAFSPEELHDLQAVAFEAIANAYKSGATSLSLCIERRRGRTRLHSETVERQGTQRPPGGGRGLRNIALRAQSRGGEAHATVIPGGFRLETWWPTARPEERVRSGTGIVPYLVEPAVLGACALGFWLAGPGSLASGLLLLMSLPVVLMIRDDATRLQQERRRWQEVRGERFTQERSEALELVRSELTPELKELMAAHAAGQPQTTLPRLETLARLLRDLLWALEPGKEPGSGPQPGLSERYRAHRAQSVQSHLRSAPGES